MPVLLRGVGRWAAVQSLSPLMDAPCNPCSGTLPVGMIRSRAAVTSGCAWKVGLYCCRCALLLGAVAAAAAGDRSCTTTWPPSCSTSSALGSSNPVSAP
jgi:hypothetical protein